MARLLPELEMITPRQEWCRHKRKALDSHLCLSRHRFVPVSDSKSTKSMCQDKDIRHKTQESILNSKISHPYYDKQGSQRPDQCSKYFSSRNWIKLMNVFKFQLGLADNEAHRSCTPSRDFLTMSRSVIARCAVHISSVTIALYLRCVVVEQCKTAPSSRKDLGFMLVTNYG